MIEPPSRQLRDGLLRLKICRPGDFRACRRRVRRLARDLPCFDSVWIDALLQARKLTPFQAKLLGAGNLGRLSVGPFVLLDQLGAGRNAATFLARQRDGTQRCVLKLVERPPESITSALAHLHELQSRGGGLVYPSLVVPHRCLEYEGRLVTISRFVPGPHLGELLVRRGRFPAAAVLQIGRQLVDVLASFAQAGGVHGDIAQRNVRLTSAGVAVLVDAGVVPAVSPQLTIDHAVSPDRYDGIAPELIGTGQAASFETDVYALGCLLWHLLAGRPPFSTGDPLAKLAAHQTKTIPDVRQWAPDTPAELAECIRGFTHSDRQQRAQAFREVRETWGPPKRRGQRRLAQFHAAFGAAAPRRPAARSARSLAAWPVLFVLLMFLSGAALTLFDVGARNSLLAFSPRLTELVEQWRPDWSSGGPSRKGDGLREPGAPDDGGSQRLSLRPLPAPDSMGVIVLNQTGPYAVADITHVGTLTIKSESDRPALIEIDDRPLGLAASHLVLENLEFRYSPGSRRSGAGEVRPPSALLLVRAQHVSVRRCRFETSETQPRLSEPTDADLYDSRPIALAWKPVDPQDQTGGQIELVDSFFLGSGPALYCSLAPHDVRIENCLKIGGNALVSLAEMPRSGQLLRIRMARLTLRSTRSLLRLKRGAEAVHEGRVVVDADQCVLAVDGPQSALFQLFADGRADELSDLLELTGEGTVVRPGTAIARRRDPGGETPQEFDSAAVHVEGLLAHPIRFAGPPSAAAADSVLSEDSSRAPSRFIEPPGIDAVKLPPSENAGRHRAAALSAGELR